MKFVQQCLCSFVFLVAILAVAPTTSADLLCAGGQVIWTPQGTAVGCVFESFGQAEKSMCNPYPIEKPSVGGDCWVCLKPGVNRKSLKVGVNFSSAEPANGFRCLNGEPAPFEPVKNLDPNLGVGLEHNSPGNGRGACSPGCSSARWTDWLDRDGPSGSGDYETLADFKKQGDACSHPLAVECETKQGVPMPTGEGYVCDPNRGAVCVNAPGRRCEDFRVRFCCG